MTAHWRCYFRLPPGHKWEQAAQEERTFLTCRRCGKEKWPFPDEAAEEAIKTYARGWGSE
jgi:RNase P subunit RPR2